MQQRYFNIWMALQLFFFSAGNVLAMQSGEQVISNDKIWSMEKNDLAKEDTIENRYWLEGEFEGVIAEAGGQTLAVLNPEKSAQWIVVFDKPAISSELAQQAPQLQQAGALPARAALLRQEIAMEQHQAINFWQANNQITQVNAQFDLLLNGVAVEASGEQAAEIADQPGVAAVYPDYVLQINLADSVPLIGAEDVWEILDADGVPITGRDVHVAVIDTGIEYTHPAFGSCSGLNIGIDCRVIDGYDFVNNDNDPLDDHYHGTHVAGIIAGNDASITGVAPEALIYAYKVCNSSGSCQSSAVIAGLEQAADPNGDGDPSDHVDVANLSLGGSGGPDDPRLSHKKFTLFNIDTKLSGQSTNLSITA